MFYLFDSRSLHSTTGGVESITLRRPWYDTEGVWFVKGMCVRVGIEVSFRCDYNWKHDRTQTFRPVKFHLNSIFTYLCVPYDVVFFC